MGQEPALGSGRTEMGTKDCVEEGAGGTAREPERGSLVVRTAHSPRCELFRHLPGFSLQMVRAFLTQMLRQTAEGQGSISELLLEPGWAGTCGDPELRAVRRACWFDFQLVLRCWSAVGLSVRLSFQCALETSHVIPTLCLVCWSDGTKAIPGTLPVPVVHASR